MGPGKDTHGAPVPDRGGPWVARHNLHQDNSRQTTTRPRQALSPNVLSGNECGHTLGIINITLVLRKTSQGAINLVRKCYLEYALYAERIWKGDILVADVEELENLDASEIHARRLNAKEVITLKIVRNSFSQTADGTLK